ncbi:Translocation protein [Mycena sanguinolenta]|uniref:Translocation protein SEC62 n=1 Tax=Mycena sanguinolenta TaxID=230812 RepID=A0A8H7CUT3_9AGAR|nr:Translocation protein [Mycena sanguinolenta]
MEQFEVEQATAPLDLRKVATFLRSRKGGINVSIGTLNGKRCGYFSGATLAGVCEAAGAAEDTVEAEAVAVLSALNGFAFFRRVRCSSSSPTILQVIPERQFVPDAHYTWLFPPERSQWTKYAAAVLIVSEILAVVRSPSDYSGMPVVWLIGLLSAITIGRLIFYIFTLVVGRSGIWILPNMFADVSFVESLIPLYE